MFATVNHLDRNDIDQIEEALNNGHNRVLASLLNHFGFNHYGNPIELAGLVIEQWFAECAECQFSDSDMPTQCSNCGGNEFYSGDDCYVCECCGAAF